MVIIGMLIELGALVFMGLGAYNVGPQWITITAYALFGMYVIQVIFGTLLEGEGGILSKIINIVLFALPYGIAVCITKFGFGFINLKTWFYATIAAIIMGYVSVFVNTLIEDFRN